MCTVISQIKLKLQMEVTCKAYVELMEIMNQYRNSNPQMMNH